jgi:spore coat protein B
MTCFRDQVNSLCGKRVRLGRGGPGERKGTLVSLSEDFLTVLSDDGSLIHYPLHHLKSLTELMNDLPHTPALPELPEESKSLPSTFQSLMQAFKGKKVELYDRGPESTTGFVFEAGDDYAKIVISTDEIVHYPYLHIRSVRLWTPTAKVEHEKGAEEKANGEGRRKGANDDAKASVKAADEGTDAAGSQAANLAASVAAPAAALSENRQPGKTQVQTVASNQTSLFFPKKHHRKGKRLKSNRS